MRTSLLLLIGIVVVAGCASPAPSLVPASSPLTRPSPQPSPLAATATPTPSSPVIAVVCGQLSADLCAKAVTVAEATFPTTHPPFTSVSIAAPTALKTCPPSGGPPGSHLCDVIVTVTTADGTVDVGLIPYGDSWRWANLIR